MSGWVVVDMDATLIAAVSANQGTATPLSVSSGSSAPCGASPYPRCSREELGRRFLDLMTYPIRKR